ncbi:MAG TPA: hypothetical protein VFO10_12555 [Oligoflexus sp.]|uniref:hypothetical protein n=1 Tax=Oligoflexus sp. TaxID=1971216 RepID=UPI002D7EF702|nr:hypothetical protein [Oligoflexus sp.]HET9238081.1 hypothetical protein [Oligoflexus sp.]
MWRSLYLFLLISCTQTGTIISDAPPPNLSQPVIRGGWALPVDEHEEIQRAENVERRDHEIRVSLAVEHFEKPGFDRYGFWDQSGNYEHAYGGDQDGSFSYRFTGTEMMPRTLEIKARLSAESQSQGKADETSDVTLLINGTEVGRQTVVPDNGVGRFYVWRLKDPARIRKLRLTPDATNELRFVVDPQAKKKHGLCIYGKALNASAPEPGEPITIVYRLDEKGGIR